jgi:dynein heavy chain
MRERHWTEVMTVTHHDLNLAEDVFKLQNLLDCNILAHREEIEDLTSKHLHSQAHYGPG